MGRDLRGICHVSDNTVLCDTHVFLVSATVKEVCHFWELITHGVKKMTGDCMTSVHCRRAFPIELYIHCQCSKPKQDVVSFYDSGIGKTQTYFTGDCAQNRKEESNHKT